jgi:16S rRNA (guanine527-N7)-methyltransferase
MVDLTSIDDSALVCGVSLNALQKDQLRAYFSFLERWNRRISLTSVKNTSELLRFHFLEACWAAEEFLVNTSALADIGSGAGFPGMAIKLYRPRTRVYLIERNYKKSVFLQELARQLSIPVEVYAGAAEDFAEWEQVELAVIRALRPSAPILTVLAENDVSLLVFHGKESPELQGWQLLKRVRFPLSKNRWAALYDP